MSTSVREYLVAELTPLLPSAWKIVPTFRNIDTPSQPILQFLHTRIEKLPEAPAGQLRNEVLLDVLTHLTDAEKSEDAIDDQVLELITQLDGHPKINWTEAVKTTPTQLAGAVGWRVTLTVLSTKE